MNVTAYLAAAIATLSLATAQAQLTVDFQGGPGLPNVVDSAGTPLEVGNEVRIGYFDTGFELAANASDLLALDQAWNLLGTTTIRDLPLEPTGGFADSVMVPVYPGSQVLHLWVFKTSGNTAPLADFSNVTEFGLFGSTAPNWTLPAALPAIPSIGVDTSEVDLFYHSGAVSGTPGSLQLTAVPEPAHFALATGLLLAGFGIYRRRMLAQ